MQLSIGYLIANACRLLMVGVICTLICGCMAGSIMAVGGTNDGKSSADRAIEKRIAKMAAEDLVFVLAQLYPPKVTTLQLGPAATPFATKLAEEIVRTGYGVQRVSADQGPRLVNYSQMQLDGASGNPHYRYLIFVRKSGFEREYTMNAENEVIPASPMRAYGAKTKIELNPELFLLSSTNRPGRDVHRVDHLNKSNIVFDPPAQGTDTLVIPSPLSARGLKRLARHHAEPTDLVQLKACSQGHTSDPGGNAVLSRERFQRVSQVLDNLGIQQVLRGEQNCQPVRDTRSLSAGVIAQLWRRQD